MIGSCWLSLSCGWLCAAGGGCAAFVKEFTKLSGDLQQPDPAVLCPWLQAPFIPDVGRK